VQGKVRKLGKKLALGDEMYKYNNGQLSFQDFGMPMGMKLNENNRWVKKSAVIPWDI
jgi:hypothetical protein